MFLVITSGYCYVPGETARTAFQAAAETLGILFRLESLVQHAGLETGFAALRR